MVARKYKRLRYEDRQVIEKMSRAGSRVIDIANALGVHRDTIYEVMKSALGARRQPMILSISTAGYINDSIYDELMKRSTSFLKGNSKERRLLPLLYIIDDIEKWNDIEELKKANPNMGVSVKESFFEDEIAVAESSPSKKAEFLTKYCNIKQNSSIAWLDYEVVDGASVEKTLEDFRDCYAVGGIPLTFRAHGAKRKQETIHLHLRRRYLQADRSQGLS